MIATQKAASKLKQEKGRELDPILITTEQPTIERQSAHKTVGNVADALVLRQMDFAS